MLSITLEWNVHDLMMIASERLNIDLTLEKATKLFEELSNDILEAAIEGGDNVIVERLVQEELDEEQEEDHDL